jgi:hypothetical protein
LKKTLPDPSDEKGGKTLKVRDH